MGPNLFLVYIDELPIVVSSSLALLFADDLKLIHCTRNDNLDELQVDLNNLHNWSVQNCLLINYKKCFFTQSAFQRRFEEIVLYLGNNLIQEKRIVKDLGLTIVDTIKWIDNVQS